MSGTHIHTNLTVCDDCKKFLSFSLFIVENFSSVVTKKKFLNMSAVNYEWHLLCWTVASAYGCHFYSVHLSEIKYYFFGLDDPNQFVVKTAI